MVVGGRGRDRRGLLARHDLVTYPSKLLVRSAVAFAAFIGLAAAVNARWLHSVDRFGRQHLQPLAGGHGHPDLRELTQVMLVPAAPSVATLLILWLACVAYRRAGWTAALIWPAAMTAGFAAELLCKALVRQDADHSWRLLRVSIDSSYPSGHMLRMVLLVFAIAWLWPQARALVAPVVVLASLTLTANGWHSPTDVVGGLAIGLAIGWIALWASEARHPSLTRFPLQLADVRP